MRSLNSKKIAIIGGGLAGAACAYVLAETGADVTVYEAGAAPAAGASGNRLGLYNPRLGAELTPESRFYKRAFETALQVFPALGDVDWNPCGALHLITDEKRDTRYRKMAQSWGWGADMIRLVNPPQAGAIAGIEIDKAALYLPRSGYVSPQKLCSAYLQGIKVVADKSVSPDALPGADIIILACGTGLLDFCPDLPLGTVRGQVTDIAVTDGSKALKTALCYGGYVVPELGGQHLVGSSFQRWLDHTDILPQDDADNLAKLGAAVPAMDQPFEVTGHKAGVRTTAKDHMPVIGHYRDNIYISGAHGSHGILSSLMGAQMLAAMIARDNEAFDKAMLEKLSPQRFRMW